MTELDPEEEAVLESARRALAPPDLVTRRMRTALLAKLAAPGIVAASSAAAAASGSAVASSAAAAAGTVTPGAATSVTAAAAAGGALAGGAKLAVSAALVKAAAGVTTAVILATATSSYWLPAAHTPTSTPRAVAAPAKTPGGLPAAPARAPSAPATASPEHDDSQAAIETAAAPAPRTPGVMPGAAVEDTAPQQELQSELDLLKRAQQAIQAGQPGAALSLLARLDVEHPASSLGQEREVARVLALCGVGRITTAREVAERVLAASPNSLYAGRIQASCAAVASPAPPILPRAPASTSVGTPGKSTNSAPPVARFDDSGN